MYDMNTTSATISCHTRTVHLVNRIDQYGRRGETEGDYDIFTMRKRDWRKLYSVLW